MKKLFILALTVLCSCSIQPINSVLKYKAVQSTAIIKTNQPATDYTLSSSNLFVVIDNTSNRPSTSILPLSSVKTLTVSSNYGAVTILAANKLTGPWTNLITISDSSLVFVHANGTQLFFRASNSIVNLTISMLPSPSPDVVGYVLYTGPSTNKCTQPHVIGNVTNATISVTGTNISPIIYVKARSFDANTNYSGFSNLGSLVIPAPRLKLQ